MLSVLDRFNQRLGRVTAWLTLAMVLVTFIVVVMRYVFDAGLIWLQESVVWMHAVVFMLGSAYTLGRDEHVRVDVFYRRMSNARRAVVDILGVLVFLWPVCALLAWSSWDFVSVSWSLNEASRESGGLPYPFIPMLKTVLVLMPVTLALQGLSMVLSSLPKLKAR